MEKTILMSYFIGSFLKKQLKILFYFMFFSQKKKYK
jgi:hypothetical protein